MSHDDHDDEVEIEVVAEPPLVESSAPDHLVQLYDRTMRSIGAIPELAMRRAKFDGVLKSLTADEAVWWLDQLVRGALWGRSPEIDGMLAASSWLIRLRLDDEYELLQSMYVAAHTAKRDSILSMLRDFPPHRALGKMARLPDVKLPIPREVTLGEKRMLAAGNDRRIIERLLHDNSPLVVEKLMTNPAVNIQDVLSMASRRPTLPGLLMPIVLSDAWFVEMRVREALVQNPYTPTGVSLRLLPTLHTTVLRKLRFSGDLHPEIAEKCKLYVDLREQRTAPWGH
ncbi:MAG: hypothetical protein R3E66_13760 [bacterium]